MARKQFHLEIISPERVFYEGEVEMIELNTAEGEIGVYADHIPLTAIVVPGVLTISYNEDETRDAAIHDGFIEILPDKVTIMTQCSEWPEEIDINRANEAKIRAERRIQSDSPEVNLVRAERALRKSLVRIQVANDVK